jgi:Tfp pilus assembly protein FimV
MRYLQVLVFVLAGAAVVFLCVVLNAKNKALDEANAARADLAEQLDKASLQIKDLTAQSAALESRLTAITGRMEKSATKPEVKAGEPGKTSSTSRRTRSHEEDD